MIKPLACPRFYQYTRFGSDRAKILKCLAHVPDSEKHAVCLEYERLYLTRSNPARRHDANQYLGDIAREYIEKRKGNNHD